MNTSSTKPEPKVCYHCGLKCRSKSHHLGEKRFCCRGCKTAYEILTNSGLESFYELNTTPGTKPNSPVLQSRFAYLDEPEVESRLLDFREGDFARVSLHIPSLHCSSCVWLLENCYRLNPGIGTSQVDFVRKQVTIDYQRRETSLRKIVELLASLGYEPHIRYDSLSRKRVRITNRPLLIKLGIAGFALGNIMLLSLPEYFSNGDLSPTFSRFFGILNILLALPVLLISSRGFFRSAWKGLRHRRVNMDVPISLGILTLFFRSLVEILSASGPGWMDSFAGLVFLLLLGRLFQEKTFQSLSFDRDYRSYFPIAVTRRRKGKEENTAISGLQPGDRILIRKHEILPVDAALVSRKARIDYSFITGESLPVEKSAGERIYAGGKNQGNLIELDVLRAVDQGYLTGLWNHNALPQTGKSITALADRISAVFTTAVVLIAVLSGFYWWFIDPGRALQAFTAVLIIACPCALALSTPFTLGNTVRIFGHAGFFLKNTRVIEILDKIDTIVFDKTGTLTVTPESGLTFVPQGNRNDGDGRPLLLVAALARQSLHPLSRSLHKLLENSAAVPELHSFREVPGEGLAGQIEGREVRLGTAQFALGSVPENSSRATRIYASIDGIEQGWFQVTNRYRSGLESIVRKLQERYDLWVVSGDHDHERENLRRIFGTDRQIRFRQTVLDKLSRVRTLQKQGRTVLMIGDGLNDAGALQQSDAGITLAENINTFTPAADGILEAYAFGRLPRLLRFCSTAMGVIKLSFLISFLYNLAGIGLAIQGNLSPLVSAVIMPLSSISVVIFTTTATNLLARRQGLLTGDREHPPSARDRT